METLEKIIQVWQEQDTPSSTSEWNTRLSGFIYQYLYNDMQLSNKDVTIDNIKSAREDKTLFNFSGEIKTAIEMKNNSDLILALTQSLTNREQFSEKFIKKINKCITLNILDEDKYRKFGERPGEYKKIEYTFNPSTASGSPYTTQSSMRELVSFMNSTTKDPIKVVSLAYCMFRSINPFAQANGRTCRMIINYYLLLRNYPPIIFFAEDKESYLEAISFYQNNNNNPAKMYQLFRDSCVRTWKNRLIDETTSVDFEKIIDNCEVI